MLSDFTEKDILRIGPKMHKIPYLYMDNFVHFLVNSL